jgi:glycerol-3-phosphate acyltransferase PlsY
MPNDMNLLNEYNLLMLVIVIISYLLGSIPTAYIVAKINRVNIFEVGSGNMGATNVIRAVGPRWGLAVMAFDMLKGVTALLIALQIKPGSNASAMTVAAISVIIGHNWSLFAGLLTGTIRGGKGAATAFGTMLMIAPIYVLAITTAVGLIIVARTRYVSLAVLTTLALSLIWITILVLQRVMEPSFIIYTVAVTLLIIFRFRENIERLASGTERRLGDRV